MASELFRMKEASMVKLNESLKELVDRNAMKVLTEGETAEGLHALHRMFLLLSMIDRLESGDGSWAAIGLLPSAFSPENGQEMQATPS